MLKIQPSSWCDSELQSQDHYLVVFSGLLIWLLNYQMGWSWKKKLKKIEKVLSWVRKKDESSTSLDSSWVLHLMLDPLNPWLRSCFCRQQKLPSLQLQPQSDDHLSNVLTRWFDRQWKSSLSLSVFPLENDPPFNTLTCSNHRASNPFNSGSYSVRRVLHQRPIIASVGSVLENNSNPQHPEKKIWNICFEEKESKGVSNHIRTHDVTLVRFGEFDGTIVAGKHSSVIIT